MKIQLFCTLFVLSAGVSAFANVNCEVRPYSTLSDCRECISRAAQSSNQQVALSAIDRQCQSGLTSLSSSSFCIEQATLNYRIDNRERLAASGGVIPADVSSQIASGCNNSSQLATFNNTGVNPGTAELQRIRDEAAAADRARQQQATAGGGTGSDQRSGSRNSAGGGIGNTISGIANGIGNWLQNGSPRENGGFTVDSPTTAPGGSGVTVNSGTRSPAAVAPSVSPPAQTAPVTTPPAGPATVAPAPASLPSAAVAERDRQAALDAARASGSDFCQGTPEVCPEVSRANDVAANSENQEARPTTITQYAAAETQRLEQEIKAKIDTLKAALNANPQYGPFPQTKAIITAIEGQGPGSLKEYTELKERCTRGAERAEFLCAEGSSPGAQVARGVINFSGPLIAGLASTQQSCSKTADMAKFTSALMSVAKGVCIGAKYACDNSCNAAREKLNGIKSKLGSELNAALTADQSPSPHGSPEGSGCLLPLPELEQVPCTQAVTAKITAVGTAKEGFNTAIVREETPYRGTVAGLKKHCDDKAIDIALMAANIGSMMAGQQSAERCAEQTAGQNASGDSTVAAGMYCDQASNQQTQFCICQRNPLDATQNCPEYLASQQSRIDQLNAENDARALGLNLRPGSGVSAFAGGTSSGATPGSSSGLAGGLDLSGGSSGSAAGVEGTSASPSAENMVPTVAGGASAGGGFGSSARGGGDAVAKPGTVDDKAPSAIKSLASSIGGLFGGKGESSDNGAISARAPSAETVQQRRASERLAAEISPANGKSNWQKVREQYLSSEPSFIFGQ